MTATIFALATAPGRSAVAVVRISGPEAGPVLSRMTRRPRLRPREATLLALHRPDGAEPLDQALVLWFPGPASFTGEDMVELHLHGGMAVIDAVLTTLADVGLSPAQPGEFTRRAFENGKLDLAQAEAIADLVDAETDAQRRQAVAQLGGASSDRPAVWRASLLEASALLEAEVDFPDEDLPGGLPEQAMQRLSALHQELAGAAVDLRGTRVREGLKIALIGAPNAGKSSIFNALLSRAAAIVTELAGTTRDVLEAPLDVAGYRVLLADTAGLRPPGDAIEAEGVRRARAWAEAADLRLLVVDRSDDPGVWREVAADTADMLVLNKADLPPGGCELEVRAWAESRGVSVVLTSAGGGVIGDLRVALAAHVEAMMSGADPPVATRLRHRMFLEEALVALDRALAQPAGAELVAEDVRLAARSLERISGRIDTEQVLDAVFRTFCIGK